ncbi:hypothetical protein BCR44DRAFT_1441533 [Catenaria anguillulae PL171]|uniref:Uncharacterized protein n=1 Tax=Catenaria anguillulae PL171 TaxID=765915 RepID=A0A1Y2HDV7_9FUNG|nr:hypothetical protein BCR44DRAFT_1441533 [Catenaria anguillulae PL171]
MWCALPCLEFNSRIDTIESDWMRRQPWGQGQAVPSSAFCTLTSWFQVLLPTAGMYMITLCAGSQPSKSRVEQK